MEYENGLDGGSAAQARRRSARRAGVGGQEDSGRPASATVWQDGRAQAPRRGRPRKPPQLELRSRPGRQDVFVIRDGAVQVSTRTADPAAAAEAFRRYTLSIARPDLELDPQRATISSVLDGYAAGRPDTPGERRDRRYEAYLRPFWGAKTIAEITPAACDAYAAQRVNMREPEKRKAVGPACAINDLAHLRKVVRLHCKRQGLQWRPVFALPEPARPRTRWLARDEVAALVRAARGRVWDPQSRGWRRCKETGRLLLRDEERRRTMWPLGAPRAPGRLHRHPQGRHAEGRLAPRP